ncbi:hypothetical protein KL905_000316 [Ogataea polymorpha]|nr:hypothetical protein KL936_001669 [Ogataea polymorpha]KAG7911573.1 hypothetical protein KL906_000894 [Ogataea polymorpha]KAG7919207.1 hypothetical protein KL927_001336 [Ogataea polymorpha]KAG7924162.1 hypothetical protein KL905_000316 [Ogataea polymorpha]KAG7937235.1 hypothetical protein KL934_001438 [Ogataea polymorpha]
MEPDELTFECLGIFSKSPELFGHIDRTRSLLATVSSDKTCRIYNLNTKRLVGVLDDNTHTKTMRSVKFRPTGPIPSLAIGSFDSTISIWSKEDEDWVLMAIIEGHENEVKSVDWSHDGLYLASCSRDKSIWIWEADDSNEEFECISVIQEHEQDVKNVSWHPTKNILCSSSYDDTCRIFKQDDYDEDEWVCVANCQGANGTVWCSDWEKRDTFRFANCSDDSLLRIWKKTSSDQEGTANGKLPSTLKSEEEWALEATLPKIHTMPVYGIAWNTNGLLASCGSDGRIVVYSEEEGEWKVLAVQELGHGVFEINCVKWWNENTLLTAGDDGAVNMWTLSI